MLRPEDQTLLRLLDSWGFVTLKWMQRLMDAPQTNTYRQIMRLRKAGLIRDLGHAKIKRNGTEYPELAGRYFTNHASPKLAKLVTPPPPGGFRTRRVSQINDTPGDTPEEGSIAVAEGWISFHTAYVAMVAGWLTSGCYSSIVTEEGGPPIESLFAVRSETDLRRKGWHSARSRAIAGEPFLTPIPDILLSVGRRSVFVEVELNLKSRGRYVAYERQLTEGQSVVWICKTQAEADRLATLFPVENRVVLFTTVDPKTYLPAIFSLFR